MRDPLDKLARPGDGEPDAGGGYDRPNHLWVCGNSEEGCPCPFGPSSKGACPELAECRPVRDGDRWRCNRPARRGGPCDGDPGCDGPTPDGACPRVHRCQPVRALRTTRRRVAVGAAVFLAGAMALLLGSSRAPMVVAPGPLTHAHARLIETTDVSRCANCHPGGGDTLLGHAAGALVGHGDLPTQSKLCLKCHEKQFDREHALLAHGVPARLLTAHGSDAQAAAGNVACAVCHQEHHGAEFNLSAMTNHRCQSCHQQRFDSFASDHPDFGAWPYRRRTRIVFDHARHEGIHFAKSKTDFTCVQCHVDGQNGAMATLGYEASCASCHDESIQRGLADGVPMLALPTIDTDALTAAGFDPGPWPDDAIGDFDGDLPGPMKLLLASDPASRAAIERLGADFSFFDLDPDDEQNVADAAALITAIRSLLSNLEESGHQEWARRLQRLSGTSPNRPDVAGGLSIDLVGRIRNEWFSSGVGGSAVRRRERVAQHPTGGWFTDPATLSIRYTATGHADPVLTAWFEAGVALSEEHTELRDMVLAELERAGSCTACHSVERDSANRLAISWRAYQGETGRPFTRFSHRPHLTQRSLADCRQCHQFTPPAAQPTLYVGTDPHTFESHFQPIDKSACTECHQKPLAGDRCTQCHNYHVDANTEFGVWNAE